MHLQRPQNETRYTEQNESATLIVFAASAPDGRDRKSETVEDTTPLGQCELDRAQQAKRKKVAKRLKVQRQERAAREKKAARRLKVEKQAISDNGNAPHLGLSDVRTRSVLHVGRLQSP